MMISVYSNSSWTPLSALHLGRPRLAHTAMKNIKTSWFSREALALGLYAVGLVFIIALYFLKQMKNKVLI